MQAPDRSIAVLHNELYGMIYNERFDDAVHLLQEVAEESSERAFEVATLGEAGGANPLLCVAAQRPGSGSIVEFLLSAGASPNCRCFGVDHVLSVIIMSYSSGRTTNMHEFEELLKAGADPNASAIGRTGSPLLHFAISTGRNQFVEKLLQYGANPHLTDEGGVTAFEVANRERNAEAMRMLKASQERA